MASKSHPRHHLHTLLIHIPCFRTSATLQEDLCLWGLFYGHRKHRSQSGPSGFRHVSSSPYGITFFNHSTNRHSDGRLVIDFVAEAPALPYLAPYRHRKKNDAFGVNFAVAGATALNDEFFVRKNIVLEITPYNIQTQLLWFNRYLENQAYCKGRGVGAAANFDDALFWFGEIGINDYASTFGSSFSLHTIRNLALYSVSEVLDVKPCSYNKFLSQKKKDII